MQRNVKFAVLLLAVLFSYTGYVQASSKAELNVEKTESAQQKRKITGVVQDDLGGVIGASVTV